MPLELRKRWLHSSSVMLRSRIPFLSPLASLTLIAGLRLSWMGVPSAPRAASDKAEHESRIFL